MTNRQAPRSGLTLPRRSVVAQAGGFRGPGMLPQGRPRGLGRAWGGGGTSAAASPPVAASLFLGSRHGLAGLRVGLVGGGRLRLCISRIGARRPPAAPEQWWCQPAPRCWPRRVRRPRRGEVLRLAPGLVHGVLVLQAARQGHHEPPAGASQPPWGSAEINWGAAGRYAARGKGATNGACPADLRRAGQPPAASVISVRGALARGDQAPEHVCGPPRGGRGWPEPAGG